MPPHGPAASSPRQEGDRGAGDRRGGGEARRSLPTRRSWPMRRWSRSTAPSHVRPDGVEVWCGTQVPGRAQDEAAKAAGLPTRQGHDPQPHDRRRLRPPARNRICRHRRRVRQAGALSAQDDLDARDRHAARSLPARSITTRSRPGLDASGKIVGWTHKVTGSSVMARWAPPGMRKNGIDPDAVECAEETPYDIPAIMSPMCATSRRAW